MVERRIVIQTDATIYTCNCLQVLFHAKQTLDFREQLLKTNVGIHARMNMGKYKRKDTSG